MREHPAITAAFIGAWTALPIVGLWVTYLDRKVARKKRLLPLFIVSAGIIFVLFSLALTRDLGIMLFIVPAVALITFLNLRQFKVCPVCGRTIHSGMWFAKAEYCSKCGARLQ